MEKERNVKLIEVWGIYEVNEDDTLMLYEEDIGTFFTHEKSAKYVASIYEKYWRRYCKSKFTAIRQLIPIETETQCYVCGIELYIGDDMYVSDNQVFSNEDDAYEFSPLYNFYRNHESYEQVDFAVDVDSTDFDTFSAILHDYYINRNPINIISKRFDLEKYQDDKVVVNIADSK